MSDTASSSGTESYWYDSSDEYESESNTSFTATDSVYYSSLSVDTSTPSEHWSAVELSPIRPSTPVVTPTKQSSPLLLKIGSPLSVACSPKEEEHQHNEARIQSWNGPCWDHTLRVVGWCLSTHKQRMHPQSIQSLDWVVAS